jgi:ABC-type Na+ transport system ATPase subunit NatA
MTMERTAKPATGGALPMIVKTGAQIIDQITRRMNHMYWGKRQRIDLARAIPSKPRLLVLDLTIIAIEVVGERDILCEYGRSSRA